MFNIVLYYTIYDLQPATMFQLGIEYLIYIVAVPATAILLDISYVSIAIDYCHDLKSSVTNTTKKDQKLTFDDRSRSWAIFVVNTMFVVLFLFANFYFFTNLTLSLYVTIN